MKCQKCGHHAEAEPARKPEKAFLAESDVESEDEVDVSAKDAVLAELEELLAGGLAKKLSSKKKPETDDEDEDEAF